MGTISAICRVLIISYYIFSMWYDVVIVKIKFNEDLEPLRIFMEARLMYITFWNVITLVVYNSIAFWNDISGTDELAPRDPPFIRKAKDYTFSVFAFPLSLYVCTTFWITYFWDREVFFPKRVEEFVPSWLNHTMHTSTVIFVAIEMFVQFRQFPSKRAAFIGLLIFGTSYASWITFGKLYSGIWIYPVIEKMTLFQQCIGPVFVFCYEGCFYLFGEFLNNRIWRKTLREIKERDAKEKESPLMPK